MIACPFCNHTFDASTGALCPRCGEMIPGRAAAPRPAVPVDLGALVKNRLKWAMLVSLLIFVAIGGIAAWKIMKERKRNAVPFTPPPAASDVVTPPLELRGLQYLPPNCNVVVALQPGPLVVHAERLKQNPADALARFKFAPSVLATLGQAGITLQEIDHIVVGVSVPDKDEELRLSLVVVLRQMRDEAKFLAGLKAKPTPGGYDVSFDKFTVRMKKRSATEWCFGLAEKDFAEGSSFSPALRDAVQKRIPASSAIWVAAVGEKWQDKPLVKLLGKEYLAELSRWNGLAAGLSFGAEPKLKVALRAADPAALNRAQDRLTIDESWASTERSVDPFDLSKELKTILDSITRP